MTLRGVIKSLLHGSGDAEAMLADDGYGDLPPEMFSQALSSYADTAPMEEADALTPVLSQLEEGSPSDVFAVLEEQPLSVGPVYEPVDQGLADPDTDDLDDLDDLGDFGAAADDPAIDDPSMESEPVEAADASTAESAVDAELEPAADDVEDPFDDIADDAAVDTAEEFEDFFATEPETGGDDPGDLDLDF